MDTSRTESDRLAAAVAASPDGLAVLEALTGPDGRVADLLVVAANPRAGDFLPAEGECVMETMPEQLASSLVEICAAALDGCEPRADEVRWGSSPVARWVERQAFRLSGREVAVTMRDATQRRRAQQALRRAGAHSLAIADEQAALRRVAEMVARDEPPEAVVASVSEEAGRLFQADSARVARFDRDAIVVVGTWGSNAPPPGTRFPRGGRRAIALVEATGRPARVDDYRQLRQEDPLAHETVPESYARGMAAPVRAGARMWGGVLVVREEGGAPFSAGDELRLQRFAELVGVAIANADAERRLRALAATDPLTQLANHRVFQERLSQEVARARRYGEPLGLVLLDLDHFKRVNDVHGHQTGDAVLTEVARRLAAVARTEDLVARVGGEEFAWLLPGTDGAGALVLAERARRSVEIDPFPSVGGLTASLGVAELGPEDDGRALFRNADLALIWTKVTGRNRAARYETDLVRRLADRRAELHEQEEPGRFPTIRALATLVDSSDPYRMRHSERVAGIAEGLAERLGWSAERRNLLREAALVHDVGKISVAEDVLRREGALDADERARVRGHAVVGAEIASRALSPEQVAWVRGHHERWDGRGYPDGLAGEGIPEGARILAVADAWEALTSPRAHRPADSSGDALAVMHERAGTEFWPPAVAALETLGDGG